MLWPDVANEPAHDHPVLAPLLFGCHVFGAMLGVEAMEGGEVERGGRERVEAVEGGERARRSRERKATAHTQHGRVEHSHSFPGRMEMQTT